MASTFKALHRRSFLVGSLLASTAPLWARWKTAALAVPIEEASVESLQKAMTQGNTTSVELIRQYLQRIQTIDRSGPTLRSVLEVNPDALDIARSLDAERKAQGPRGPLHGIPVLIKDNIDTADKMKTTAGSLALVNAPTPKEDAPLVAALRQAGAVILGKTNLSEWANFRSTRSSSGWSGRGLQTKNPYALDRNPSGSSSGTGSSISANLATVGIGTETDGSIVSPSNANGLVGFKPTVGLVSRRGIIPISHTQDTPGPMTRSVRDAALVLSAIAGIDPKDPATLMAKGKIKKDYTEGFETASLKGVRLGLLKTYVSRHPEVEKVARKVLDRLSAEGAILVDVELPERSTFGEAEREVLSFEFKADLNAYLAERGGAMKTLKDLIDYNESHKDTAMPFFGQEIFLTAQARGDLKDEAYLKALAICAQGARQDGIDAYLEKYKVEALISPTSTPAWLTDHINVTGGGGFSCSSLPAVAGYPHLTIPMGSVHGLPIGMSLIGNAWSDHRILQLGYAFEKITQARFAPRFLTSAEVPN